MSDELKPCPKCGGDHFRFERWVTDDSKDESAVLYRPICENCSYAPDHWDADPQKAIEYWNTRPLEDALRAQLTTATARAEAAERRAERYTKLLRRFLAWTHITPISNYDMELRHDIEAEFGLGQRARAALAGETEPGAPKQRTNVT